MTRQIDELERKFNIIMRAAREFGLNVDDLYAKACDKIDENGYDRYVTDVEFGFDWHNLSWNDGMGFDLVVSGEFNDKCFMRETADGSYERIKEYEVEWGKDYQLVHDTIDSEGQRVGFLVRTPEL